MKPLTYHLQSDSQDYYGEINEFTSLVLAESEGFIEPLASTFQKFASDRQKKEVKREECILEALMLGVYWNNYSCQSLHLQGKVQELLSRLSTLRNEIPHLKEEIDNVRGIMATMFLMDNSSHGGEELVELNLENMDMLLKWLDAAGDYQQELKHMQIWRDFLSKKTEEEIAFHLTQILMFADWFSEAACKNLSKYTPNVNEFIHEKLSAHLNKEDILFCGRKQVEYHLNMVGAEIMNRVYRERFEERPRKAVLLPGCMKYHQNHECQALEEKLGLKCTMCSKNCPVAQVTAKGLKEGYEVYIISHESSAFSQSTKKDQEELGIVGVACVNNLVAGGWKSDSLGIPAQCVVLEYVGCANHWHPHGFPTQINPDELEKIMNS